MAQELTKPTGVYISQSPIFSSTTFSPSSSSPSTSSKPTKGLFASRAFTAGSQIFSLSRPLVAALDDDHEDDACANCYFWVKGGVQLPMGVELAGMMKGRKEKPGYYVGKVRKVSLCAGCRRVVYCCKACQKESWARDHKFMCKKYQGVPDANIPKACRLMIELLIRRKEKLISDELWETILQMESHVEDFKKRKDLSDMVYLAEAAGDVSKTADMYPKSFFLEMYARVLTNAQTLVAPDFEPLGIVFDPWFASCNHSCDPNAYVLMDACRISLRTFKPIQKDEEILVSYIDTTNPYSRRQWELSTAPWFFECRCSKCQLGPTLEEDKFLIAPEKLSKKFKQQADKEIKAKHEWATHPANYVGDSEDEKRVAALQGLAYEYHSRSQKGQTFAHDVSSATAGMALCKDSGLWASHRQPYPMLREALVVADMGSGQFHKAFLHCVKSYIHIYPKLTPIPWDPTRVVQLLRLSAMAQFISSDPSHPTSHQWANKGVDLPVMGYVFQKELMDVVVQSHGKENSFYLGLVEKSRDMLVSATEQMGLNAVELLERSVAGQRDVIREMADWVD